MTAYPAKLLLFGEHTVNAGSQALAIPLTLFSGRWRYAPHLSNAELASRQMQLPGLADFLEQLQRKDALCCQLDLAAFRSALQQGLIFESDIPRGYGAGSSGAVVAALFGEWTSEGRLWARSAGQIAPEELLKLKRMLAQMEAFFHGTSSGTDPLVCFLKQPVLLGGCDELKLVHLPDRKRSATLFLLDTGIERKATPLIRYFLQKMELESFHSRCSNELLPAVDQAIAAFLSGDAVHLFEQMHRIGAFQLRFLEKLIPEKFWTVWKRGLEEDLFKLKICGAGGGGFLLGIAKDFQETKSVLAGYKLLQVW